MDGTTTTTSGGAGDEQGAEAPTSTQPQLVATAVGEQCQNCGARLAGDQRYCVECGQRRGKPRYAVSGPATATAGMPGRSGGPRRPRLTANGTLIAGVGTLLLAMGVGVLIGRSSNGSSGRTGAAQIVTIAGAGSSSAPATSTPTTTSTPTSKAPTSSKTSSTKSKSKAKAATAQLQAKLPAKAKVVPKALKSKVAKVGSKCAGGGTFTGTYFGSGASRTGCSK